MKWWSNQSVRVLLFTVLLSCWSTATAAVSAERPNIVLVIADDLMKQISLYEESPIETPRLCELAKESLLFERAYCQYPLCGPSRASLFLSTYPVTSGITWNQAGKSQEVHQRAARMGRVTMPKWFRDHGYLTVGGGKLYHNNVQADGVDKDPDFEFALANVGRDGIRIKDRRTREKQTLIVAASEASISEHRDGALIENAQSWLREYTRQGTKVPFFMCLGIKKPHSPFAAPKSFFERYDRDQIQPTDVPAPEGILKHYSLSGPGALLRVHPDTAEYTPTTLPLGKKQEIIQGYQACVTYVDHLVGELVDTLQEADLYDNTILIFTSDHGYKLGEYNRWAKYTLHEKDLIVPLLVRVPSFRSGHGKRSDALVGLVDLYPTLAELCGLPTPADLDGRSFLRSLQDPDISARNWIHSFVMRPDQVSDDGVEYPKVVGASIMDQSGYRYTQWWNGTPQQRPTFKDLVGEELYDHYQTNQTAISIQNLRDSQPELLLKLRQMCFQWNGGAGK